MLKIDFEGVRYWSDGCSPERFWTGRGGAGTEAPPGAYDLVEQYWNKRTGRKQAGRRKMAPGQTIDELRLVELESGRASEEELARRDRLDIESLRRSLRRARNARKQAGQ